MAASDEQINMENFDDMEFEDDQIDYGQLDLLAWAVLAHEALEKKSSNRNTKNLKINVDNCGGNETYGWAFLPEILLEDIFVLLTPKYRHVASQVCWRWHQMFYSPRVWAKFVLNSVILTRRQFYNWNRRELVPQKAQMCLSRVGHFFKRIVVEPIADYYNLHQFLRVLGSFLEFNGVSSLPLLQRFEFAFACETHGVAQFGSIVHGTGGQILQQLACVIRGLYHLNQLYLNELLLEVNDACEIIRIICDKHGEYLTRMELLNLTKTSFPLVIITQFSSLKLLSVSPQQLDEEVVLLLSTTLITELRIVQDRYTTQASPVSAEAWKALRELAPYLYVRLDVRGPTRDNILIQPSAPVRSVVFSTPYSQLSSAYIISLCDQYSETLEVFVQESIPKISGTRTFHNRGDSNLVMIVNKCKRLNTLIIHDRISTATALIVSYQMGKLCKRLEFRRNALIKRCDWPKAPSWSYDFYKWLKTASRCYDTMAEQVSHCLGWKWQPLNDSEFKKIKL